MPGHHGVTSMKDLTPARDPVPLSHRENRQRGLENFLSSISGTQISSFFVGSWVQYLSWFHPNIVLAKKKTLRKYTADVRRIGLRFEFCQIGFYTDHILLSGRGFDSPQHSAQNN